MDFVFFNHECSMHCKVSSLTTLYKGVIEQWLVREADKERGTIDILELQQARVVSKCYSSFFVDQSVQSDGSVYVGTRIDPIFLVLIPLFKYKDRWTPLNQCLQEFNLSWLVKCEHMDISRICDVNDQLGENMLLYRLNESKVLAWLTSKVNRITQHLSLMPTKKSVGLSNGIAAGFYTPFIQSDVSINVNDKVLEQDEYLKTALEIVCEYLPQHFAVALTDSHKIDIASLFESRTSNSKRKIQNDMWENTKDEDRNLALSLGIQSADNSKKTKVIEKTTNKLAKVNTRGMKSLMTHFSKKN